MKRILGAVKRAMSALSGYLASAVLWFLLLTVAGAAMIACGIYMLIGMAWSLIFGGIFLIALSGLIRRGIASG